MQIMLLFALTKRDIINRQKLDSSDMRFRGSQKNGTYLIRDNKESFVVQTRKNIFINKHPSESWMLKEGRSNVFLFFQIPSSFFCRVVVSVWAYFSLTNSYSLVLLYVSSSSFFVPDNCLSILLSFLFLSSNFFSAPINVLAITKYYFATLR